MGKSKLHSRGLQLELTKKLLKADVCGPISLLAIALELGLFLAGLVLVFNFIGVSLYYGPYQLIPIYRRRPMDTPGKQGMSMAKFAGRIIAAG